MARSIRPFRRPRPTRTACAILAAALAALLPHSPASRGRCEPPDDLHSSTPQGSTALTRVDGEADAPPRKAGAVSRWRQEGWRTGSEPAPQEADVESSDAPVQDEKSEHKPADEPPPVPDISPGTAQEPFRSEDGFFLLAYAPFVNVGADMDGNTAYTAPGEVIVVPSIDDGFGFGLAMGYRGSSVSFELGYQRTYHDWTSSFTDVPSGEAVLNAVNLDTKFHLTGDKTRLQPFLLLGVCFPWLDVERGSYSSGHGYGDVTYIGVGANLGGGISYYLTRHLSLVLTGGYRLSIFASASGEEVSGSLDESLTSSGWFSSLGVGWTF